LTRAALIFAGATAVAACGGKEADGISKVEDAGDTLPDGVPVYGLPAVDSGGPATVDSGIPRDGGGGDAGADDAGPTDGGKREGGAVALYGPSPVDGG